MQIAVTTENSFGKTLPEGTESRMATTRLPQQAIVGPASNPGDRGAQIAMLAEKNK
jgi:hypothetical protein